MPHWERKQGPALAQRVKGFVQHEASAAGKGGKNPPRPAPAASGLVIQLSRSYSSSFMTLLCSV